MPSARLRAGPSAKVVVMIESPAGAVNAAAAPLTKRAAISSGPLSTSAPSSDAAREHRQRAEQHAPAPEQVGRAPAEQQQAAVAEHVTAHHPLQGRGGEAEVGVDAGERDADHRDVQSVEEEDAAEDEERDPGAPVEGGGVSGWGGDAHPPIVCIRKYCKRI